MAFKKAVKEQVRLKLALCALAGAGKTYSALAIGSALGELMRQAGHGAGRVAVIDTERGSASLYADKFDFDVVELSDFSPLAYVEAIREAEIEGYDIIVVDSLSHAWAGKGGALDQKDAAAERGGNSWTAWRNVTPKHNALVDAMLMCRAHLIATMRVKMEHVQETVNGKTEIKKVGLASIQREGMEYEFTCVGDIDLSHTLKISKTRIDGVVDTGDLFERPGATFAKRIYGWLTSGAAPAPRPAPAAAIAPIGPPPGVPTPAPLATELDKVFADYLLNLSEAPDLVELDKIATGPGKPEKGTRQHALAGEAYLRRLGELEQRAAS